MKNLNKKLKKLIGSNELKNYVINYILEDYKSDDDIKCFFSDLLSNGCQSGMIGTLIYYNDTNAFFNKYQSEIEELKEQLEDDLGEPLQIKGNITNWLAWFGFEETARNLANEIGLDAFQMM